MGHRTSSPVLRYGAIAGVIATGAMSAVMLARKSSGKMGRMPPKVLTQAAIDAAGGDEVPESAVNLASVASHFAFGAAAGRVYAGLSERMPASRGIAGGMVFGTLVWLVSYAGWVPALGIMPPPPKDRRGRPFSMLLAHWVYGAVLGALLGARDRRR